MLRLIHTQTEPLGHIVQRRGKLVALDNRGVTIGIFYNEAEAAEAIRAASLREARA